MDCMENVGDESLVLIKQGAEAVSVSVRICVYVFLSRLSLFSFIYRGCSSLHLLEEDPS